MRQFYVRLGEREEGPYPEEAIRQAFAAGQLDPGLLGREDPAAEWRLVAALLGEDRQPPPLALAEGPPLVQVEAATKSFGDKTALRGISFAVPSGQICGLLGPNGAGKTTLFRLLMGILKATEGTLTVGGLDAFEDRTAVKRLIGFLPDEPVFYSYLSGREILELSAAMHGLDVAAAMQRLAPTVAQLRLAEDLNQYAEDYSRGMKKKLGLLLALLHEPKLLILDEPTNGLDVESTQLFYELVRGEATRGTTILFSTHLMDHVARLCSHVVIINEGTVVERGALSELRARFGEASLEEIFLRLTARPAQGQPAAVQAAEGGLALSALSPPNQSRIQAENGVAPSLPSQRGKDGNEKWGDY